LKVSIIGHRQTGLGTTVLQFFIRRYRAVRSVPSIHIAYTTAQIHDIRAFYWSWSSLSVMTMAGYTLVKVL